MHSTSEKRINQMVSFILTSNGFIAAILSKFTRSGRSEETKHRYRVFFLVYLWVFRLLDCRFNPIFRAHKMGFFNDPNVIQVIKTGGF